MFGGVALRILSKINSNTDFFSESVRHSVTKITQVVHAISLLATLIFANIPFAMTPFVISASCALLTTAYLYYDHHYWYKYHKMLLEKIEGQEEMEASFKELKISYTITKNTLTKVEKMMPSVTNVLSDIEESIEGVAAIDKTMKKFYTKHKGTLWSILNQTTIIVKKFEAIERRRDRTAQDILDVRRSQGENTKKAIQYAGTKLKRLTERAQNISSNIDRVLDDLRSNGRVRHLSGNFHFSPKAHNALLQLVEETERVK